MKPSMKIHLVAIGGSAMHNLAIALKRNGNIVTGSDDEIYEPSRTRLAEAGLLPESYGWFPEKIDASTDIVIVGMHAKKDNPELERANQLNIQICSYPEFIFRMSNNKQRIVIAGSHGKTTITSMILHVLRVTNRSFDYLVGAQVQGFETMVRLSEEAPVMVVEGDEYLASPLDLRPKFLIYKPHIVVISGIAWDHVNVFPEEKDYVEQFVKLVQGMDKAGMIIYNDEDKYCKAIVKKYSRPDLHYLYPYSTLVYKPVNEKLEVKLEGERITVEVFGKHNVQNLHAAWKACRLLGVDIHEFSTAMMSFRGAQYRLEKVFEDTRTTIFRDFAHAPSKVKATVEAILEVYDKKQVLACLELHTFSSLNAEFLPQYKKVFKGLKKKIVFVNRHTLESKKMKPLTREDIISAFEDKEIVFIEYIEDLIKALHALRFPKTVFLMMSSGNFGGLDLKSLAE